MNSLMKSLIVAMTLVAGGEAAANERGPQPFGPFPVDSLKVNAKGTSGRTAHQIIPISAGPDRVFLPDSIKFVEGGRSGGGLIEARFLEDRYEYVDVPMTVDGQDYMIPLPQVIYISMYAETGSGMANYNRGGWLNGHVTATTIEFDH